MNELVKIENNVPLADSRVVADELGVQHGPFMTNIIIKYQKEVELECGQVHFKNEVGYRSQGGGNPERYALLTEVQTNSYLSLARNTPKSIPLKIKLAKAFDEAKQIIAQLLKANLSPLKEDINAAFRLRRDENKWLHDPMRYTVEEKTSVIALQGHLQGLDFAENAFLDNSMVRGFYPWCKENGYDMSLVRETKDDRLVGWELKKDGSGEYDLKKPTYKKVYSYPEDPFGLAWTIYLVECYWPQKFLPYITRKYKGEERAKNVQAGIKVISLFTGLAHDQITSPKNKKAS